MDNKKLFIIGLITFLIVVGIGYFSILDLEKNVQSKKITEKTIIIKDKYIKNNPISKMDQYLVVDTDNNTYKITDTEIRKNSTDLYNVLDIGKEYTFIIEGERNPEISEYPNLIKIVNT